MALFSRSSPKPAAPANSRSTTKMSPKAPKTSSTIAVVPKSASVAPQQVSKSMRLRNATERIHAMKSSAAARPGGVKRAMPTQKIMPKTPTMRLPGSGGPAGAAPQKSLAEVITTERKIRTSTKNKQVGQLLLKAGKITEAHIAQAEKKHAASGGLFGQILVDLGACSKSDVAAVIKQQRTITTVNLTTAKFDLEAIAFLDRAFCEKHKVVPFEICGNQLCVAMSNALDTTTKNEIKEKTQQHIKIFDASNNDIQTVIKKYYSEQPMAAKPSLVEEAKKEEHVDDVDLVIELPDEEKTTAAKPAAESPATAKPTAKTPPPQAAAPAQPQSTAEKSQPAAEKTPEKSAVPAAKTVAAAEEEEPLLIVEEEDTPAATAVAANDAELSIEPEPQIAPAAPAPTAAADSEEELIIVDESEEELELTAEPESAVAPSAETAAEPAAAETPVAAEETASTVATGGDMPSIAESLEDMDINDIAPAASAFSQPPLPGAIAAIPVSKSYADKIVVNGFISPEARWLAAIRAEQPVPALPMLFKVS